MRAETEICAGWRAGVVAAGVLSLLLASTSAVAADRPIAPISRLAAAGSTQLGARARVGQLLVASRTLDDTRFRRTVILLVDHGPEGSMGLVINRPSTARLSAVLPELEPLQDVDAVAFLGGPVGLREMLVLFRGDSSSDDATPVVGDLHVSSSLELLGQLAEASATFRVYVGYCGWAVGQLEVEILRGDWHVLPADVATVFETPPNEIWPTLIARAGQRLASRATRTTTALGGVIRTF